MQKRIFVAVSLTLSLLTPGFALAASAVASPCETSFMEDLAVGGDSARKMLQSFAQGPETTNRLQAFFDAKPFPAVVMPNGEVRIRDGHTRSMLAYLANPTLDHLQPTVRILRNYQSEGKSMAEAVDDLMESGGIYFSQAVRHNLGRGRMTLDQAFERHMPKDISGLSDSPKRSILGIVLKELLFDSTHFSDFIEFHLIEKIESQGFAFPDEFSVEDRDLQESLKSALLRRDTLDYLAAEWRNGTDMRTGISHRGLALDWVARMRAQ